MKTKLIFSLTLLTLVIAACGGQTTQVSPEPAAPTQAESQPVVSPTLTVAASEQASAPTDEAAMPATEAPAAGGVSFANDVMPIFAGSCNDCHGGKQTKAGLDVTTYDSLMAGSFDGIVILAGNSAESILVQQVVEGEMPKRGPKLTAEQIQIISQWIDAGALNN
jgi:mono/diheme cytochrome c family protein